MSGFRQHRTWRRAHRLSLSQLACLGRHTVSNLLCACARQFDDWSADYRLFSKARWDAQDLFAPVVQGVLDLVPDPSVFVTALDDTHLHKTGKNTPGVGYKRDPLSPPFHCNLIRAQRFLQLSAMLYAEDPGPARAIPVRYEHAPAAAKPKRTAPPEAWDAYKKERQAKNLSTRGVAVLHAMRKQLDQMPGGRERQLISGTDGSFTNRTVLKNLPERTTLIGRVRKDAKFFSPPRPEDQPAKGAKRKYGQRAPTPEQLRQDDTAPWQTVRAFASGKLHEFRVKTVGPILWKKAGHDRPLRLVVIAPVGYRLRKGSKLLYRQPAYLICTDPDLPLAKILQYYLWRWDIEVNHRDEKQIIGVGQAQVRSEKSVDRQPAFATATYAMLLLAAARAFGINAVHTTLPPPKWRKGCIRQRVPTQEILQQFRSEIWARALNQLQGNSDGFAPTVQPTTKPPECDMPMASAVLYSASA